MQYRGIYNPTREEKLTDGGTKREEFKGVYNLVVHSIRELKRSLGDIRVMKKEPST